MSLKGKNPVLVFGMPRSGTTPISEIVAAYLSQTSNVKGLGEYFNYADTEVIDTGRGIKQKEYPKRLAILELPSEKRKKIVRQRLELLKKYHGKYTLKILPTHLNVRPVVAWLMFNYDWIFVERKNLFENYLSFLVSAATDQWYKADGIRVAEKSLNVRKRDVLVFRSTYLRYLGMKETLKPKTIIYYEDFVRDPKSILRKAGLKKSISLRGLRLSAKQNRGNKLSYFKDPAKVRRYYAELVKTIRA